MQSNWSKSASLPTDIRRASSSSRPHVHGETTIKSTASFLLLVVHRGRNGSLTLCCVALTFALCGTLFLRSAILDTFVATQIKASLLVLLRLEGLLRLKGLSQILFFRGKGHGRGSSQDGATHASDKCRTREHVVATGRSSQCRAAAGGGGVAASIS